MITLKCRKHPRYKADIAPKASCEACVELYFTVTKLKINPKIAVNKAPERIAQ